MERKFWDIKAAAGAEPAELWIYDDIGSSWWSEGVTAKDLCREIAAINATHINVRINSPGGSVVDGLAIYNALQRHPATVTTHVDGLAASIASVIALAGSRCVMAEGALYMIHNPWTCAQGDAEDMRKAADVLDKFRDSILAAYSRKTGRSDAELQKLMDDETWLSAEEAVDLGFADEITAAPPAAAAAKRYDLPAYGFRRPPQAHVVTVNVEVEVGDGTTETEEEPTESTTAATAATSTAPKAAKMEIVMEQSTTTAPAGATNEAAEIVRMCVQHGCADKAADYIASNLTADQVGRKILEAKAAGPIHAPAAETVDMGKQAKNYSYKNAIAAAIGLREGQRVSSFEVDIHQELLKSMPANYAPQGGLLVPMATTLTTTGTNTGAELLQTQYGDLIGYLYNKSVCSRLGANVLTGLKGPLSFPKQTASSTLYWVGEAPVADVTSSNPGTAFVTLSPKTAMATVPMSRNLMVQSTPNAEALVRNDLGMIAALGIDKAAIHGTGQANDPTGIYAAANVNAKAMGGVPTFGKLQDMITATANYNALFENSGWATTPGMAGKLAQTLVASAAGSKMVWDGTYDNGTVNGYKALASNQVSAVLGGGTNEHGIIFGDFSQLLIGQWGGIELIVDPYTQSKKGLIDITLFLMIDVQVRYPQAFAKATGATIA